MKTVGSLKHGPWVKSREPPIFVNKVLFENLAIPISFVYCPWLLLHHYSGVESLQQRSHGP